MKGILKTAFGLGLVAAVTTVVMNVGGAAAITSGHFVSDSTTNETTKLFVEETTGTVHQVKLTSSGSTTECHHPTYAVQLMNPNTRQDVTVTPTYKNCTTGGNPSTVHMNGCHYAFTSRAGDLHATVHFKCPAGKTALITTETCTITIGEQTPSGGVTYQNVFVNTPLGEKHAVTAKITAKGITVTQHGLCQFMGTTSHSAEMHGAVVVQGFNTKDIPVDVTHT